MILRYAQKSMSRDEFVAANLAAEARQAARDTRDLVKKTGDGEPPRKRSRRELPDELRRKVYKPTDFAVPFAGMDKVEEWYQKYPCLQKRNFYLVQNHHATAKHFDLRIHLDGQTISFAIPRGLSPSVIANNGNNGTIQAIETSPHGISYTLFEGGGIGTTAVWDLGTYKMHRTKASIRKREGMDSTTDDDSDAESFELPDDYVQEDRFCEGYHHGAFKDIEARHGHPRRPRKKDHGDARAFVIELNGERYKGLKLRFFRESTDFNQVRPKDTAPDQHVLIRRNRWLVKLADPMNPGIEAPLGDTSILTGRTMQEIKDCRPAEESVPKLMRHKWEEFDDGMEGVVSGLGSGMGTDAEEMEAVRMALGRSMQDQGVGRGAGRGGGAGSQWEVGDDGFEVYDPERWERSSRQE
ncbi:ATP-dependent DNA ligase-like protein [Pseudohyphozyma bogoriensis]|nr:ATP-dependent DNA ligase-like protein [Pseudohyphozyma bogoriensis]